MSVQGSLDEQVRYNTYEASILTHVMVFILVAWRVKSEEGYGKLCDNMIFHSKCVSKVFLNGLQYRVIADVLMDS